MSVSDLASERGKKAPYTGLMKEERILPRTNASADAQQQRLNLTDRRHLRTPIAPIFTASTSLPPTTFSEKPRRHDFSGSADLYKRDMKFVGLGTFNAVVDAQIQEVHGVAADRFLRTASSRLNDPVEIKTRSANSAAKFDSIALDPSLAAESSNGRRTVYFKNEDRQSKLSRCLTVGNELDGDCRRLKNRLAHSSCTLETPYESDMFGFETPGKIISDPQLLRYKPKNGITKERNQQQSTLNIGSKSDFVTSEVYSSVCHRHGILSASELDTFLSDIKSSEASNRANRGGERGNTDKMATECIVRQEISDADAETISIALYLRDELLQIPAADDAKITAYKSHLIADLGAVLRAKPNRFEIRGLFEGVVAEVFFRSSDDDRDKRQPSQLAEELAKCVQSKPAILDGTRILRNANSVKVRGLASRARPLAFLMKKLEAKQSDPGSISSGAVIETPSGQIEHEIGPEFDRKFEGTLGPDEKSSSRSAELASGSLYGLVSDAIQEKLTSADAHEHSDNLHNDGNVTLVEAARSFVGDKTRGQLELSPGMKIVLLSSDGSGWCFGNIVGPTGARHYPGGWFPAELVRRHDPIAVMSEITLDSSGLSLGSDDSICESEIDIVEEHYTFDDFPSISTSEVLEQETHWERDNAGPDSEKMDRFKSSSKSAANETQPGTDNQLWTVKIEIMEATSLPCAHTIGLLPDTYVCISLLCANQCDEPGIIIDHCVDNEPAVDDTLLNNTSVFRIPPQAQTSIVERSKNPFWGESFNFSRTRPYLSVIYDTSQRKKLVSTDLETVIHGQDICLMVTVHERNLFGPDCWIARSETMICPSMEESLCVDSWMTLRQMDGSRIRTQETTSIARMRVRVNYSSLPYPDGDYLAYPKDVSEIKLPRNMIRPRIREQKSDRFGLITGSESKNSYKGRGGCAVLGPVFGITDQSYAEIKSSCDFQGFERLDKLRLCANPTKRRADAGVQTQLQKCEESSSLVLSSSLNSNSSDELVLPIKSLKRFEQTNDFAADTKSIQQSEQQDMHGCVEIDMISASNLRKSPDNGLNPNPYFCVSLVSNVLLNSINSGYLNHPVQTRGDQHPFSYPHFGGSQNCFEVPHQYRSAVVHHSQVPSWKLRIVLHDFLESTGLDNNLGERKWHDLLVSPVQLAGQPVTMLISVYDLSVQVPNRFLGKIIIPLTYPGIFYDQNFPFLDLNGDLMDSSHGYLHISCRYKTSKRFDVSTPQHCLQFDSADLDLSATTSSTYQSESSLSADSSPRQLQPSARKETLNEIKFSPRLHQAQAKCASSLKSNQFTMSVQPLPNSARSEETETSMLKTARSIETVCGVLEPASSLIHSNSFESERWIPRKPTSCSGETAALRLRSFENAFKPAKPCQERSETWPLESLLSIESQAANSAVPEKSDLKAANTVLFTVNSDSLLALDSFQSSVDQRSASNPFFSSVSSSHVYTSTTNQCSLSSRPGNFDCQIRRSQSSNNSAFGVDDSTNSGKCRFELTTNEPSELQKAFMARKLIPTRDQIDY
eukprot:CAMPEP_0172156952 /NCGR_PEP_ID=MMETSP1050-20130122/3516_1 /TAXON_ID=233186 /ORGANISM="Cryptomonas curvata, Strain CCAP979/52" /LENGTH=1522 /DNA_ID=CAMNT_0012826117 /DNA_START=217 /DNA_END=4785 /DNA_ORIENTATION=+